MITLGSIAGPKSLHSRKDQSALLDWLTFHLFFNRPKSQNHSSFLFFGKPVPKRKLDCSFFSFEGSVHLFR